MLLIFVGYLNYLVDAYMMYAASAIAANTVCRSACGAAAPLFTSYMFDKLGVGGAGKSPTRIVLWQVRVSPGHLC
jgi:MFS transporter, DHA1 family, multidrug resistance protein